MFNVFVKEASVQGLFPLFKHDLKRVIQLAPMKVSLLFYKERVAILALLQEKIAQYQQKSQQSLPILLDSLKVFNDYIEALENDPRLYLTSPPEKDGGNNSHHFQMQLELFEAIKSTFLDRLAKNFDKLEENSSALTKAEKANIKNDINEIKAQLMKLHFIKAQLSLPTSLKKGADASSGEAGLAQASEIKALNQAPSANSWFDNILKTVPGASSDDLSIAIEIAKDIEIDALEKISTADLWLASDLLGVFNEEPSMKGYNRRVLLHAAIVRDNPPAISESIAAAGAGSNSAAAGSLDEDTASSENCSDCIYLLRELLNMSPPQGSNGDWTSADETMYCEKMVKYYTSAQASSADPDVEQRKLASALLDHGFYAGQKSAPKEPISPEQKPASEGPNLTS